MQKTAKKHWSSSGTVLVPDTSKRNSRSEAPAFLHIVQDTVNDCRSIYILLLLNKIVFPKLSRLVCTATNEANAFFGLFELISRSSFQSKSPLDFRDQFVPPRGRDQVRDQHIKFALQFNYICNLQKKQIMRLCFAWVWINGDLQCWQ